VIRVKPAMLGVAPVVGFSKLDHRFLSLFPLNSIATESLKTILLG
jgi:hypothetical protein